MAVGLLLLLIGVLRLLQEETGSALTGNWSWVPYFVVAVLGIGVVGVAAWRDHRRAGPTDAARTPTAASRTATPKAAHRHQRRCLEGRNDLMASPRIDGHDGRLITRDDLQAAYSQVLGEGEATARAEAPAALAVVGAVGLALITLAFLAGRRRGRSRSAVVEIRRL